MNDDLNAKRDEKRDEALKGVIGSIFGGDLEDFSYYNEEYEKYGAKEIGTRGKKAHVSFGGSGGQAVPYHEEADCPNCGKHVVQSGVRFVPAPNDPRYDELTKATIADDPLYHHYYNFPDTEVCPAWKHRRAVFHAVTNKYWRTFWHFGMKYGWQNLRWDHKWERYLYRSIIWKEKRGWKIAYSIQDFVGWFEQRAWERGKSQTFPR